MPAVSAAKLYTPDLLSLATELATYPLAGDWERTVEVRSRTCGSTLRLGIATGPAAAIARLGMAVSACAVGQAAAAIFARSAPGLTCEDAAEFLASIEHWLSDESSALPDWPDIAMLQAAREHAGRHGAILLPWKAAVEALCNNDLTR